MFWLHKKQHQKTISNKYNSKGIVRISKTNCTDFYFFDFMCVLAYEMLNNILYSIWSKYHFRIFLANRIEYNSIMYRRKQNVDQDYTNVIIVNTAKNISKKKRNDGAKNFLLYRYHQYEKCTSRAVYVQVHIYHISRCIKSDQIKRFYQKAKTRRCEFVHGAMSSDALYLNSECYFFLLFFC